MLKYALAAIGVAVVIAVAFVMLPTHVGQRPEPRILTSGDVAPQTGFVVRPATPPDPATTTPPSSPVATPPASPGDLDAVMQRLRAAAAKPDASTTQATAAPSPGTPTTAPATAVPDQATPATSPVPSVATPTPTPDPAAPPPSRWTAVTAQGVRWRMVPVGNGYVVSIDLGAGQVADVRVQQAFGALDTPSVNVRVDFLRNTILQNFSRQSGSYSFARDGSVSLDR